MTSNKNSKQHQKILQKNVTTKNIYSKNDTLIGMAKFLSAELTGIKNLNEIFTQNLNLIDVGWVLFIPKEKNGV